MPDEHEIKIKDVATRLRRGITRQLKASGVEILEEYDDAREFVEKQTRKMGELALELAKAPDKETRDRVRRQMDRVSAIIETELLSVANAAAPAAKSALKSALAGAGDVLKEVLPVILPAIL